MPEPPPTQPDLELPKIIGRYEVLRLIGEGAMGRVLCAHDPVLGRDVAVKLLRGDLLVPRDVREGLLARMRHEARAAARVAHPNLVTLHDMGEDPRLGLYLVFEYVEGKTLKERLKSGPLPPGEAARLARELGSALTFAHNEGILHRDIKPENVILSRTGGKIADFGIARIPDSTLTHAGGLMGTPAYSAPETFGGKNFSFASDQFSLAAMLYEAIRGERAFPGDDAVEVAAHIAHDPPERFASRRGLPAAIDDVFARALAKSPVDRFASCEDLGDAVEAALAPAIPPSPRTSAPSSPGTLGRGSVPSIHDGPNAPKPRPSAASATTNHTSDEPAAPSKPPAERKRTEILLGAAAITVTAILLVRTAMQQDDARPPPIPAASATSAEPAASANDKPKASPSSSSQRATKPRTGTEPSPADSSVTAPATTNDAGLPLPLDGGPGGAESDARAESPASSSPAGGSSSTPPAAPPPSSPPPPRPSPAPTTEAAPPAKQPGSSP